MKKKIIIWGLIILLIILTLFGYLIYKNHQEKMRKLEEQKTEERYEKVYNYSYNIIMDNNEVEELKLKSKDEKLIYEYFNNILTEKENLKLITYDEFINQNDISKLYENPSEYLNKLETYNTNFDTKKKEIEDKVNKTSFINYLKENKCSNKGITILNKKVKEENLKFESEEINNLQNSNIEKSNILSEYITYLNENKNNWYLENGKLIVKTNDALNKLTENNKIFNINITVEKEKPKVVSKQIPIFMYHGVSDNPWGATSLFMSISKFDQQMKYLNDNGYKTIFADELETITDYTKTVMLTFDDGYTDFYENALPILKKYNIKANLYVISGYMGGDVYATPEQIKEIANSGLVSIGSHTISHASLNQLSYENIEKELSESKQTLENLLGKEVTTIAYPKGHYDSRVLELTKKYYKYAFLVNGGVQSIDNNLNRVAIKRIGVYSDITFNSFKNYCEQAR